GGPNTITLINNCSHNVSVAWCYIPAPGALQSEGTPIQGNQICIHNGTDFPQAVLASSGSTDLSRTYRSWELPYSQNTIYHLACNAGADGKALPRISGFDDVLRGSCPALEEKSGGKMQKGLERPLLLRRCPADMAEAVRFELTDSCPSTVFKTVALNHSATLPELSRRLVDQCFAAPGHACVVAGRHTTRTQHTVKLWPLAASGALL